METKPYRPWHKGRLLAGCLPVHGTQLDFEPPLAGVPRKQRLHQDPSKIEAWVRLNHNCREESLQTLSDTDSLQNTLIALTWKIRRFPCALQKTRIFPALIF